MKKFARFVCSLIPCLLVACTASEPTAASADADLIVDLMIGGPAASELLTERNQLQQGFIVECMKVEGFEYVPPIFQTSTRSDSTEEPTDYGWVEDFRILDELGSNGNVTQVDPTAGLGAAETEAYAIALGLDGDEDGCWATARIVADKAVGLDTLMPLVEEAAVGIREWRRSGVLSALNDEWLRCMRERGFEISGERDLLGLVETRWQELAESDQDDAPALRLESNIFAADSECSAERNEIYQKKLTESAEAVLNS